MVSWLRYHPASLDYILIFNRATSAKLLGGLMKFKLFIIFLMLLGLVACAPAGGGGGGGDENCETNGSCGGCCSSHNGVICDNGTTRCGDGSALSATCRNKGCYACINCPGGSDDSKPPEEEPPPPPGIISITPSNIDPNNMSWYVEMFTHAGWDLNDPTQFCYDIGYVERDGSSSLSITFFNDISAPGDLIVSFGQASTSNGIFADIDVWNSVLRPAIPPGGSTTVPFVFEPTLGSPKPDQDYSATTYWFESNDPDLPTFTIKIVGGTNIIE